MTLFFIRYIIMEDLIVRRAITSDAVALQPLVDRIGDLLVSRYGVKDIAELIESSCLTLTAVTQGEEQTPVAMAMFKFPPQSTFYSYKKLKLSCFLAETQYASDAARLILRSLFESQPTCDMVETDINVEAPLETSLVPFFIQEGPKLVCRRDIIIPPLVIRAARVEDYDDLMPLFEQEAADLLEKNESFFVSDLIKNTENYKCLVAEGDDGLAVGFVAIQPDFDLSIHAQDYDLIAFQKILNEKKTVFRISLFFIADKYRLHSRDFIKPIFALMRDADYFAILFPTNSPPSPLAPFLTKIPSLHHGTQCYNLYLCHRDAANDIMLNVRKYTPDDASLLENFVEPLNNRVDIIKACEDKPENVHLLLVNEIIQGISVFEDPNPIDHTKWDIEEFVDVKHCNSFVQLRYCTISPLFQRFLAFFLVRSMEIWEVKSIYMLHKTGYFPDILGRLFLAVERRQGPANPEFQVHIEREESLHLFPMRWSLQPKQEVTASIVIVGNTEGVASFLYKLISVPYLHFSALHVVCEGADERIWVNTYACREYMPDWLQHIHLLNGATFFNHSLKSINRPDSTISIQKENDERAPIIDLHYDFLVLLTAKQGETADMWMAKKFCETKKPPVSVVGDSLVAYYILSHYPGCAHIAHNPRFKLEGTLATIIRDSAVANCDFREVSPKLLDILEKSSLVYDGGIVIDELFRTNDPKVFAAGPITMFSRPYRAKDDGALISQTEYGRQIGAVILRLVDPTDDFVEPPLIVGSDDALLAEKNPSLLPKFSLRRAEMYQLPGSRIFFRNGFPAAKCRCLETVNSGRTIRFFVDAAGFIQAFEYLGESTGMIYDWTKFIGLPAVLLNNMVERFDQKRITDFAEYFTEEWCAAILHDRFRRFFDQNLEKILAKGGADTPEAMNEIREALLNFLIENADLLPNYFTSEDQLPPLDDTD